MLLDYELVISCALAALAILCIIDLRQKRLKIREKVQEHNRAGNFSSDSHGSDHADARLRTGLARANSDDIFYKIVVALLILALAWFAARIWMQFSP